MGTLKNGLPARYGDVLRDRFQRSVAVGLRPGLHILDVGSGAHPSVSPARRPSDCRYVGLDVDAGELERAPAGIYDEVVVADLAERLQRLEGQFDVATVFHVLEHVRPLQRALENLRVYLRPGGSLVAMLSGAFAAFALANRVLPDTIGKALMERLMARDPETVFHAHYDGCWYGALERALAPWSRAEIVPIYQGAEYFNFALPLRRAYLAYENWAARRGHLNLATHYLVEAVR
jgi:SAM-dependent methyltransferase